LAAIYLGLDDDNPQAFGRCIDRSRKPGRSRTDHRHVNGGWHGSGGVHPQRFHDFEGSGLYENLSVVEDGDRQRADRAGLLEQCSTFR